MLRTIRGNLQGRAAKVILGLIIIPFVFFGLESLVGNGGVAKVMEINGELVDQVQLEQELYLLRREVMANMGDSTDYAQLEDERLTPIALERISQRLLREQAAQAMDMAIANRAVEKSITQTPIFQVEGRFSVDRLDGFLADQGFTLAMLKQRIASDLLDAQLRNGIGASQFALPSDADLLLDIVNERREVNWLKLSLSDSAEEIVLEERSLQQYYDAHREDYRSELQLVLEYLQLRSEDLQQPVSDQQVEEEYLQREAQFDSSERRRVAHILLEVSAEQSREAAAQRLSELRQRLLDGEDFSALAKAHSQDSGSAQEGGDLGYTERDGSYPEDFEAAVFSLQPGELSSPVESDVGLHLIQVTEIDSPSMPALAEMAAEIRQQLQSRAAQRIYVEQLDQLADISFNASDLSEPARQLDLVVEQSAAISRGGLVSGDGGDSVLNDPRVLKAVFSEEVLADDLNSEVIELSPGHSIVLRIKERHEPRQLPFDEVRAVVAETLRQERALASQEEQVKAVVARIEAGETLVSVAESRGDEQGQGVELTRRRSDLPADFLQAVFESPRRSAGGEKVFDVTLSSGDSYVYQLLTIQAGSHVVDAQQRQLFQQQLQLLAGQHDLSAYMRELNRIAEIQHF